MAREIGQAMPVSERPQIVMMTAHGSTQIVREAFKLGVEDFLEKPFDSDTLLRTVRDRPTLLQRFPNGAGAPGFWQKNLPETAPRWLR